MAEDQGKEEEKFDFTGEGEVVDYISLEQARVLAIRHARDNPDFYGASYSGINLVWEVISLEEGEDYYDIKLSFRPAGRFRGDPGIEQFTIDKTGNIEIRQMLDEPTGVDETIESEIESRQISDEPSDMGEPESLANQSVAENSAGVAEVRVLHPAETPSTPTVTKPIETTISKPIITPLKISIRTPRYEFLQQWGPDGGDAGQLRGPVGIAVDENRVAYVTEWDNNRVSAFDSSARFLTSWGFNKGDFDRPYGIALQAGRIYVTEFDNGRIQVFERTVSEFNNLLTWGTRGTSDGQFISPSAIAVNQEGRTYVADHGNQRVQVFDKNGQFLDTWGKLGSQDGEFVSPTGIALDQDGNVYVTDVNTRRIQVFDAHGKFLIKWGSMGNGDGQFDIPIGIAIDRQGNVYVVDSGSHHVQVFRSDGGFLAKWGSKGEGEGQFDRPSGIAIDEFGNVFIADRGNNRIQVFAPVSLTPTGNSR